MPRPSTVLVLSSDETHSVLLRELLARHAVLTFASDLAELHILLESSTYDALFCEWSFHCGIWSDALAAVKQFYPELPVIVFSKTAAEEEWIKVLDAGAFDLLVPPYSERPVLSVLEQAVASHDARLLRRGSHKKQALLVP